MRSAIAFTPNESFYSARIQITHEHVLDVGKKLTESQKKVLEGVGRGIERVCKASM